MSSDTPSPTSAGFDEPTPATEASAGTEPELPSTDALRDERQRIAQRLHDTICQELAGCHLIASGAALKYRALSPDAARKLDDLAGKIQRAGASLGAFVGELRADDP